jgi:hypothetical protein
VVAVDPGADESEQAGTRVRAPTTADTTVTAAATPSLPMKLTPEA